VNSDIRTAATIVHSAFVVVWIEESVETPHRPPAAPARSIRSFAQNHQAFRGMQLRCAVWAWSSHQSWTIMLQAS